jgi:4-hydroxy-tetrahydrodipicolinate reductase
MEDGHMRKEPIRVAIWGFGAMGSGMARMILSKQGFDIIGVCDMFPEIVGKSIFALLNVPNPYKHDVIIQSDIEALLNENHPEVVLCATDSFTKGAYPKIKLLLEKGCHVISTAEEMAFPQANNPILAASLDQIAKCHQKVVLGTGVNPGMMMDLLAIALTGVMTDIESIEISRINSLSPFGKTVMEEQGVGLSLPEFHAKKQAGQIAGHVGFKESTQMISTALGTKLSDFQQNMDPIVTKVDRESFYGKADKGHVCGVAMKASAILDERIPLHLNHPQQIEPHSEGIQTGDYIHLKGKPAIHMAITPEVEGGLGTIAICVNMIPHVMNAKPGLKTMIDLPVPRAIIGDVRQLLETE